jgi:ribonucleotide monophosphatase NagD (HAD superfamily)
MNGEDEWRGSDETGTGWHLMAPPLSAGPFIQALEFAYGVTVRVMGKPPRDFFTCALRDMNLNPEHTAMIGDYILTNIGGAQPAGLKGILVRTGKYREDRVRQSGIKPDIIPPTRLQTSRGYCIGRVNSIPQ